MYFVINKWVTAVKVSNFSGQYLRNHWTLNIGVLGYIGIVWPKEHSPEVWSVPPVTPCIIASCWTIIDSDTLNTDRVSSVVFWVQASCYNYGKFTEEKPSRKGQTCFSETSVLIQYIIRRHILEGRKIFSAKCIFF